jgi:hypothetical protein
MHADLSKLCTANSFIRCECAKFLLDLDKKQIHAFGKSMKKRAAMCGWHSLTESSEFLRLDALEFLWDSANPLPPDPAAANVPDGELNASELSPPISTDRPVAEPVDLSVYSTAAVAAKVQTDSNACTDTAASAQIDTEAHSRESSFISRTKNCFSCNSTKAPYTCPRCKIPYCSVACYKKHDSDCTGHFFDQQNLEAEKSKEAQDYFATKAPECWHRTGNVCIFVSAQVVISEMMLFLLTFF